MKIVGFLLMALFVLVAASAGRPYDTPVVEEAAAGGAGTFDGLLDLAAASPRSSPVRVLWTHGMCTHPPVWVDDRVQRLRSATGGTSETIGVRTVGEHGALMRTERISTRTKTLDVMFLSWSPLTSFFKAALNYDRSTTEGGQTAPTRAMLNRELKRGLINDCLTDVVVYGGPNGRPIRNAMNEAVCHALGGHFDGRRCAMPSGHSPATLALVTESLGAKLVLDAIADIWKATESAKDETMLHRLADSLAATRAMYMLSNQLPLLVSAGPIAAEMASARLAASPARPAVIPIEAFGLLSRARSMAFHDRGPMTMVAFSDPNDLLSYRIIRGHLAKHLQRFRVVNVIVSNDDTYFGYIERPGPAHCGYAWNPFVLGMLARGYHTGKPFPAVAGLPHGSCLEALRLAESGT